MPTALAAGKESRSAPPRAYPAAVPPDYGVRGRRTGASQPRRWARPAIWRGGASPEPKVRREERRLFPVCKNLQRKAAPPLRKARRPPESAGRSSMDHSDPSAPRKKFLQSLEGGKAGTGPPPTFLGGLRLSSGRFRRPALNGGRGGGFATKEWKLHERYCGGVPPVGRIPATFSDSPPTAGRGARRGRGRSGLRIVCG